MACAGGWILALLRSFGWERYARITEMQAAVVPMSRNDGEAWGIPRVCVPVLESDGDIRRTGASAAP